MTAERQTARTEGAPIRSFPRMIEDARIRKGISKERTAYQIGTTPPTLRGWMRGQRPDWEWVGNLLAFIDDVDEPELLMALRRHGAKDVDGDYTGPDSPNGGMRSYRNSDDAQLLRFPYLRPVVERVA